MAIARSMRDHPIVGFHLFAKPCDPDKGATQPAVAFIDLIMDCKYEAGFVVNGGRKMAIQRGQLVGAVSWLAARWNWTPKAVRIWLDKLEADGMISRLVPVVAKEGKHQGKVATIITLCNYEKYQTGGDDDGPLEGQTNGKQGANEGQHNKDNNLTIEQEEEHTSIAAQSDTTAVDRKAINREAARRAFVEWQTFAKRIGLRVPRDSSFQTFGRKIAARMFQHADDPKGIDEMLAVWQLALAMIERSQFCRGMTATKFYADLKFLCQPESFDRLIEGGYGNGAHTSSFDTMVSGVPAEKSEYDIELEALQRQTREASDRLKAERLGGGDG